MNISLSFPSRLALWMGVGLLVFGYFKHQSGLMMIGAFLVVIGTALWIVFKPEKNKTPTKKINFLRGHWKQFMRGPYAQKSGTKDQNQTSPSPDQLQKTIHQSKNSLEQLDRARKKHAEQQKNNKK